MNEKKKILFLIHTLQVGGAEKVLVNLVNSMNKEKFDITVMTVINTGAFRNKLSNNIKYKTIFNIPILNQKNDKRGNEKSGNLLNNSSKIKKILADIYRMTWRLINCSRIHKKYIGDEYDVEISFLEGIPAKIIATSKNKKSKKIAWIHVDLIKERKSEKFFKNLEEEKKVYEKFDNIVGVSEVVKEQFVKKFSYNNMDNVIVKYNPIDVNDIINKSTEEINDIEKNKFTLCSVGRLTIQKGYDRLLKVVNMLNNENLEFDLWIIGVGPEEQKLMKYIKENSLHNVKLLGYKQNPYKYIKKSDAFVCSSRAEGFSTVVSEAIILERPIVTTDCAGMKEMLGEENQYGMVVENSIEGLYSGIYKMITNKAILNNYNQETKKRKKIFDLYNAINEVEELLLEKNE